MLEQVYETIFDLIGFELPKGIHGLPMVGDLEVQSWLFGQRAVIAATPAIILQAQSSGFKKIAQGLTEVEHKIQIQLAASNQDQEDTEHNILDMVRQVQRALMPHTIIWVMTKCPICLSGTVSPNHYTTTHPEVMAPFVASAQAAFLNTWYETHPTTMHLPTLDTSAVAARAMFLLFDAVKTGGDTSTVPAPARARVVAFQFNQIVPIRELYDVSLTDCKPSDGSEKDAQLLHQAEFTLTCNETLRQTAFGPDNVPDNLPASGWR